MKRIKLTKGKYAKVDDSDYADLMKYKWYTEGTTFPYAVSCRREKGTGKQIFYKMHRVLMNADKGQMVDHINRDTLDNRRRNLRFISERQNLQNKALPKSGYTGVYENKNIKGKYRWKSAIRINGKYVHLGYYKTKGQAHCAYIGATMALGYGYAGKNRLVKLD